MKNFQKILISTILLCLLFPISIYCVQPDIKINNSDTDINLTQEDSLNLSISLESENLEGEFANFKIQIKTDNGLTFSYVYPDGWKLGDYYAYQGLLFSFDNIPLLYLDNLNGIEGDFEFLFEICLNEGTKFSDSIKVSIHKETSDCDISNITKKKYIMAFNAYDASANGPQEHKIYIAGSDDGINWDLIDNFDNGHNGSVPELIFYNNFLYLFHTSGSDKHNFDKLNACFDIVYSGESIVTDSNNKFYMTVDPSLIVNENKLILFYLPGVLGMDPAGCGNESSCEKEIDYAITDENSFPVFTKQTDFAVKETLGNGSYMSFSDPEIIRLDNGTYILYVSVGQSVIGYISDNFKGPFEAIDANSSGGIINNMGGVPSAIQVETGEVWIYVNKTINNNSVILRCVSKDGITSVKESDCTTVIDSSISEIFTESTQFSSPSIIKWPEEDNWSKAVATN